MKPLKILHVIGQRPEMTGSGIYLEAIIREPQNHGFSNYWIAGVPAGRISAVCMVSRPKKRILSVDNDALHQKA
jgi:hypothetical protein